MRRLAVLLLIVMAGLFSSFKNGSKYECDRFTSENGKTIEITFIKHASLMIAFDNSVIQIDPNESYVKYDSFGKADYIIVTHAHSDHFDLTAFDKIIQKGTRVICTNEVAEMLRGRKDIEIQVMKNGDSLNLAKGFDILACPAHNYPERSHFHPEGRDNGYLLTLDGFKIYISGDTEDIPELKELEAKHIDVAFLPVNQPYTMTVEQAEKAVKMISPKIFYPYHYGMTDIHTDINKLANDLKEIGRAHV